MEAVIFVGIQASGKSAFYRERFFDTHVRISLDMLRTRHREWVLVEACMAAKQPFVVDNTNGRAAERARYVGRAKATGFRVVGYYFPPDLRGALERNSRRADRHRVPPKGLVGTYKRLEPPTPAEGFDQLYCVRISAPGEFAVADWVAPGTGGAPPVPGA